MNNKKRISVMLLVCLNYKHNYEYVSHSGNPNCCRH